MLTEKGYLRPTYDDLLNAQIARAKILFGDDIDTSEQSVLGKYIRLCANDYADIYEDIELLYYSRFPNSANGHSIDKLCPFAGISRILAVRARHEIKIKGEPNTTLPDGFLLKSSTGRFFYTLEEVVIEESGFATAIIECESAGVGGNTSKIEEIVNPHEKIESVSYVKMLVKGEEEESDYALRKRFHKTITGTGSGTMDSILGAVARVPGVTCVNLVENDTDVTDAGGRPPKSFEVYVLAPGSADYEVAEAIFSKKPVGIPCLGGVAVDVKDAGGLLHTIRFSRSIEISVFAKIKIKTNKYFETTGTNDIKENLSNYIFGLENGMDVILSSLYGYIHKVVGVAETSELLLSTDGGTFEAKNIICGDYEVARMPIDRIEIEVLPYE